MSRTTIIKIQPTLTKGYNVTLYSDCLRETALYTIYRNSPNLGCPKGQCEYSHYTLVFDTSRASLLARGNPRGGQFHSAGFAPPFSPIHPDCLAGRKTTTFSSSPFLTFPGSSAPFLLACNCCSRCWLVIAPRGL